MKSLLIIFGILFLGSLPKEYHKTFFDNGNIKEEGWLTNTEKTDYWYFYYENGLVKSEGHFEDGKKNEWWVFYNNKGEVIHKCQLENNIKNGYCLKYENTKIKSAEKYSRGEKIKEWFTFKSFKAENNIYNLR